MNGVVTQRHYVHHHGIRGHSDPDLLGFLRVRRVNSFGALRDDEAEYCNEALRLRLGSLVTHGICAFAAKDVGNLLSEIPSALILLLPRLPALPRPLRAWCSSYSPIAPMAGAYVAALGGHLDDATSASLGLKTDALSAAFAGEGDPRFPECVAQLFEVRPRAAERAVSRVFHPLDRRQREAGSCGEVRCDHPTISRPAFTMPAVLMCHT